MLTANEIGLQPPGHEITGDQAIDLLTLKYYQVTPVLVRQADRLGVWARCLQSAISQCNCTIAPVAAERREPARVNAPESSSQCVTLDVLPWAGEVAMETSL